MKRTVRITESDITRLVKKIVNEQERIDDPSDKYFMEIDYIANYAIDEAMEPEDIEAAIDEISDIMGEADSDEDLSDDELDDIISYGGQVIMELESMFDSEEPMYEQSTNSKVVDDWKKFPCVAKLRDVVSPKGEKSKRGEDVFKDLLFYSNGRCMDITNKSKSFYKCHPSGAIVVSDDPNIDMDTIDVNTEKPMYEQSSKNISCLSNSGYKKETIGGPMTRREVYTTKKNGVTYQISINGGVRVFDNKTHKEGKWSCENGKVKISGLKDTKMMPM